MNPSDKEWKEKKLNHYDNKILFDNKNPKSIVSELMNRDLVNESNN